MSDYPVGVAGQGLSAAIATYLFALLRVPTIASPPVDLPHRIIVLPDSARLTLTRLGLGDLLAHLSHPVAHASVRWSTEHEGTERPGGVAVDSASLVAAIHAQADELGVTRSGTLSSVDLSAESNVPPRAVAPGEVVHSTRDSECPLPHAHQLESFRDGWWWSISDTEGTQTTRFGDGPDAALIPTVPASSLPEDAPLPIGSAAYTLNPLSSLGTALSMRTVLDAVAVVLTSRDLPGTKAELRAWYVAEQRRQAFRVHALTVLTCRDAASRFPTPYWKARSHDTWVAEADDREQRAAERARQFLTWSQEGSLADRSICAVHEPEGEDRWRRDGPRMKRAPVPDDVQSIATLVRTSVGQPLAQLLPPFVPGEPNATRKRFAQVVGQLYEDGTVDLV